MNIRSALLFLVAVCVFGYAPAAFAQADLGLTKTVSNASPNVGDTITFTVTLQNSGPASATGVTVTDLLPPGLTFVSATPSQGTYSSGTGAWTVGTVTTVTPQTLAIQAMVASPAAQTNTATITASGVARSEHGEQHRERDGNTAAGRSGGDKDTQHRDTGRRNELHLDGDIVERRAERGDKRGGAGHFTGGRYVRLGDALPRELQQWDRRVWTIGTVSPGSPKTLAITVTAVAAPPTALTNTATVSNSDQFDPSVVNNSASSTVTVAPPPADLGLTKTVSNATPNVGDAITFTVTLQNSGPNSATNVAVTDLLPRD
jgi:uncharacterized repeat protein (TIGR01451 family)